MATQTPNIPIHLMAQAAQFLALKTLSDVLSTATDVKVRILAASRILAFKIPKAAASAEAPVAISTPRAAPKPSLTPQEPLDTSPLTPRPPETSPATPTPPEGFSSPTRSQPRPPAFALRAASGAPPNSNLASHKPQPFIPNPAHGWA